MIKALLTIDDAASDNTPAIIDYLCEKKIPAILFAVGQWTEKHPDELIYALQHGFIVGNHSYSHPAFRDLTLDECKKEIDENEKILNGFYAKAGVERRFRPFRFPYGDKGGENREELQKYLRREGFHKVRDTQLTYPWWKEKGLDKDIDTYWTFDFEEYSIRPDSSFTLDDVMKRIYDKNPENGAPLLSENSNHILLLHAHDETEALVPGYYKILIEELIRNGVIFTGPEFMM